MSKVPLEKLTAHERWELADFGDSRPSVIAEQAAQHTAATMQQLREIAKLREEAKVAGQAEGYADGYAKGLDEANQEVAKQIHQLSEIGDSFVISSNLVAETASAEILSLALDITRAMIGTALKVQPELIIATINKCVRALPFNSNLEITVNPSDAALVTRAFARQIETNGWFITEDDAVLPGGCKLDTAKNHIDATIEQRWKTIISELHANTDWISNDT